jgi:hypothetical protein
MIRRQDFMREHVTLSCGCAGATTWLPPDIPVCCVVITSTREGCSEHVAGRRKLISLGTIVARRLVARRRVLGQRRPPSVMQARQGPPVTGDRDLAGQQVVDLPAPKRPDSSGPAAHGFHRRLSRRLPRIPDRPDGQAEFACRGAYGVCSHGLYGSRTEPDCPAVDDVLACGVPVRRRTAFTIPATVPSSVVRPLSLEP